MPELNLASALQQLLNARLTICTLPELNMRLALADWPTDVAPFSAEKIDDIWQNMPYWAFVWSSGHALAQYIQQNPAQVRGKRVIDFGAGSGVVAIAAAQAGARQVIACDIDPLALQACAYNANLNGVQILCSATLVDVQVDDVILAGDVLYDTRNRDLAAQLFASGCVLIWAESEAHTSLTSRYTPLARVQGRTVPNPGDFDTVHLSYIYRFEPR
jgi:predicted nicotinamide N-methyase